MLLLLILTAQGAVAQENAQGLTWGFKAGDTFDYDWTLYDEMSIAPDIQDWSQRLRVEIMSLPKIPANVESLSDLPYMYPDNVEITFENETAATIGVLGFTWMAWPIGNWPLIVTLLHESFAASVYVNTDVSLTQAECIGEFDTSPDYSGAGNGTVRFLLSNGVMSYLRTVLVFVNPISQEDMVMSMELVLIDTYAVPILATVALGVGTVGAVIVIEVLRRRKT